MATLIRIKRSLTNEPAESIVVKTKRQRIDGIDEERLEEDQEAVLPTSILQRVATVTHKGEKLQSDILHAIQTRRRTGEDLCRTYKRPNVRDLLGRETIRQHVQARASQNRFKLHAQNRGNMDSVTCGKEVSGSAEDEGNKIIAAKDTADRGVHTDKQCQEEGRVTAVEKLTESMESGSLKYYDVELPWPKDKDVITCNGVPLESEKYVYDIYYSPQAVDWTEFVCEVERYDTPCDSSSDEIPDDEDDENDEDNWRNEYPEEEEEDSIEDEDECMDKMIRYRSKQYDTDESFDADEYDDDADFDEDGSLLPYGETGAFNPLRLRLSRMKMDSEDEGATRRDSDHSEEGSGNEDHNVDM